MQVKSSPKSILDRLKRIEGQIRGIQKMIEEDRYCIEILTQLTSVVAALKGVEDVIMEKHLETCVAEAMQFGSEREKQEKINEIMDILSKFRKY
jgi:DNA-binding FrmR family transcriptional regulator